MVFSVVIFGCSAVPITKLLARYEIICGVAIDQQLTNNHNINIATFQENQLPTSHIDK